MRAHEIKFIVITMNAILPKNRISKSYVRPDDTAVLTCPYCNQQKIILANSFIGYKRKLKVKCYCKQSFLVLLEFRRHIRKRAIMNGNYSNYSHKCSTGNLIIQEISLGGMSFTSLDIGNFKVGDKFRVDFTLNDEHLTEIKKDVVVRNIRQRTVGCEFKRPEDVYGGPLGYYIVNIL
jgi:hypothetical protein